MVKRPVVLEVPLVLDSFYFISFLQFLLPFPENDCSFDGLLTLLRESGRHSKSSVKAVVNTYYCECKYMKHIFELRMKDQLMTVPCNENVPRLLLQQLRCYFSPIDV